MKWYNTTKVAVKYENVEALTPHRNCCKMLTFSKIAGFR